MATVDGLDPAFASAIEQMIAASGGKLYIESGYRDAAQQQALWNAAVAKYGSPEAAAKWVAPPGHSNHERGMAVDLGGDIELAHTLAPRFGLIFPMGWEPWHVEPVHARESSSQQAYTTPPPGQSNPVTDPSIAQQPQVVAASVANAMRAALDPTVAGPVEGGSASAPSTGGQGASSSGTPAGSATGGKGIPPAELYRALRAQGLPAAAAAALTSIAGRESGYVPDAFNGNTATGDQSYGLFQVNLLNGGWGPYLEQHGMTDPASALRTVQGSVEAAKLIYDHSGLTAWGGYKGVPWSQGVNVQTGVDASGGETSMADVQALP